jgi:hypothetical protein
MSFGVRFKSHLHHQVPRTEWGLEFYVYRVLGKIKDGVVKGLPRCCEGTLETTVVSKVSLWTKE